HVYVVVVPVNATAPIISAARPTAKRVAGPKRESARNEAASDISGIAKIIRWGGWIEPTGIDNSRIVIRHVNRFEIGRFNGNVLFAALLALCDLLLLVRRQLIVRVGLRAQTLNGIHYVWLLR